MINDFSDPSIQAPASWWSWPSPRTSSGIQRSTAAPSPSGFSWRPEGPGHRGHLAVTSTSHTCDHQKMRGEWCGNTFFLCHSQRIWTLPTDQRLRNRPVVAVVRPWQDVNGEQILHQDWVGRFQHVWSVSNNIRWCWCVDAARRCSCCRNEVLRRSIPWTSRCPSLSLCLHSNSVRHRPQRHCENRETHRKLKDFVAALTKATMAS